MTAFLAVVFVAGSGESAGAQTRSLKIYFTHTKERGDITYKKNGRYVQSGLNDLNNILRDWRQNEATDMDPRLFDLLWEVYQASGSKDYIHIVSAYRSPKTNNMLRSRSSGVAKKSQHMLGKAIDFFIPDVPVKRVREIGMKFQVGGVGYYPTSGWPFVHLDVGSVRAWPRMSRQELVSLFPDGKTMHLPPDGKKLAGYDAAVADYQRRVGASEIAVAGGGSRNSDGGGGPRRNLFAMLFGNTGDEDEEPSAIASAAPARGAARPASAPAAAPQRTAIAALLPNSANAPIPVFRPAAAQVAAPQVASLEPVGPSAPPPGVDLASATLPAGNLPSAPVPPAAVPAETSAPPIPEKPAYVDLASYTIPVPQMLADRSGVSVYTADQAPAFEGRDVTDVLLADAQQEAAGAAEALRTALAPVPEVRPETRQELAALEAMTNDAPSSGSARPDSGDVTGTTPLTPRPVLASAPSPQPRPALAPARTAAPAAEEAPQTELAALSPGDPATGAQNGDRAAATTDLGERMALRLEPRKGDRPTGVDAARTASRATRIEPELTETMVSRWAIGQTRVAALSDPVTSPRFVSKELRQAPELVYTTGFSAETVDPERFTGAAVNFLSVARFKTTQ